MHDGASLPIIRLRSKLPAPLQPDFLNAITVYLFIFTRCGLWVLNTGGVTDLFGGDLLLWGLQRVLLRIRQGSLLILQADGHPQLQRLHWFIVGYCFGGGGLPFLIKSIWETPFFSCFSQEQGLEAMHAVTKSLSPSPVPCHGERGWSRARPQRCLSPARTALRPARHTSPSIDILNFQWIIVAHHSPVIAKLSERITIFIPHDRSKFPPKLLTSPPRWEDQLLQHLWDS